MNVIYEKTWDRRRLEPSVLRRAAAALAGGMSVADTAGMIGKSTTAVRRIKMTVTALGLTADGIRSMPAVRLYRIHYDLPEERAESADDDGAEKIKNGVLIPSWYAEARKTVEGQKRITAVYRLYLKRAEALKVAHVPRSTYFRSVRPCIRELKEIQPDFYIAQTFAPAVQVQCDYSGSSYTLHTPAGDVTCRIMAVAWPYSYYMGAVFVRHQGTADSIEAFDTLFRRWRCLPLTCRPDNAKCWVVTHAHADAVINRDFDDYMQRLGIDVDPAGYYRPRAKSCIEHGISEVQAMMDDHREEFYEVRSIGGHNAVLQRLVDVHINAAPFRGSHSSTREFLFNTYERPAARPLPREMPEPGHIESGLKVQRNYCVKVNGHEYSVDTKYIGMEAEARISLSRVEIMIGGQVVATHLRDDTAGRTVDENHKPPLQKAIEAENALYATPEDVIKMAASLHPALGKFCEARFRAGRGPNAMSCCKSIIRRYQNAERRELFAEACLSVLNMSPENWNTYAVKRLYTAANLKKDGDAPSSDGVEVFTPPAGSSVCLHGTGNTGGKSRT